MRNDFLVLLDSVFLFGYNLIFELVLEAEVSHLLVHELDFLFVPLGSLLDLRLDGLFTDTNASISVSRRQLVRTLMRVQILIGKPCSSLID